LILCWDGRMVRRKEHLSDRQLLRPLAIQFS
jgi:hypothetical protein